MDHLRELLRESWPMMLFALAVNLGLLVLATWLVVKVLQWTGVL